MFGGGSGIGMNGGLSNLNLGRGDFGSSNPF